MIKSFDELNWIITFFDNGVDLKTKGIDRVRNFTLLWNLFETYACNKNANINSIKQAVDNINQSENITSETMSQYVDYFSDRYFNADGTSKQSFDGLKFDSRPNGKYVKEFVKRVLIRQIVDPKEILKALLVILYRFRNNLFHGEKKVVSLNGQIDNFKVANHILADVLTIMKRNDLIIDK